MQVDETIILSDATDEEEPVDPLLEVHKPAAFSHKSIQADVLDIQTSRKNHECYSLADWLATKSGDKACQVDFRKIRYTECYENPPDDSLSRIMSSDEELSEYTGIHSHELLKDLVERTKDLIVVSPTNKEILPLDKRIILTMAKIKLNLSFTSIAILFDIKRQTAANYFRKMRPILETVLKTMDIDAFSK